MIEKNRVRLAVCVFVAIGAVYLLQLLSPLRLVPDVSEYLSAAAAIADGHGVEASMQSSQRPMGYPLLVAALTKLGIANSVTLVALNLLFLGAGLLACYRIYRQGFGFSASTGLFLLSLTLLSCAFIFYATTPMSDIPFWGISMLCLWALMKCQVSTGNGFWITFVVAILLMLAAILVRPVGVALFPAVLWTLMASRKRTPNDQENERRLKTLFLWTLVVSALFVVLLAVGSMILAPLYVRLLTRKFHAGASLTQTLWVNLRAQLFVWGQMIFNFMGLRHFPLQIQRIVLPLVGLAGVVASIHGATTHRKILQSFDQFALWFFAIVFVYPYFAPRLWLPLIPLLIAYMYRAFDGWRKRRLAQVPFMIGLLIFSMMGVVALVYSTRISLARSNFPELFIYESSIQPTYRVAFGSPDAGDLSKVNAQALKVLQRYDLYTRRIQKSEGAIR